MKQKVFLAVVALFMLFAGSLQTKAESEKDYYSKVQVVANPSGAGKVYAAFNGGDYKENEASSGKVTQKGAPTHTYKIKAEAKPGYYSFSQWKDGNTDAERTVTVTATTNENEVTQTYTAEFTAIKYFITLNVGDGDLKDDDLAVWPENKHQYTAEDEVVLPSPIPSDHNYNFGGWYDNEAFEGNLVTTVPRGSIGDKIFYAKYVPKQPNAITINGETNYTLSVPFGKQLTVASANPANTIVVKQTSGAEFATYEDGIITTGVAVGQATWDIYQAEDDMYEAADATLTVNVEPAAETESYVLIHDDEVSLNMYGGTKSYAVSNYPKRLSIQVKKQGAGTQGFTVKYNGETVLNIANGDLTTDWKTFTADLDGSVIAKVEISSGGTLDKYYRNLRVTRKTYLNVEDLAVNETAEGNPTFLGEQGQATMTVDWSCANGGDLNIVCDNDKFTFSPTTISGVDNNNGKTNITVTYDSDAVGTEEGHVTIYNDVYRKDITISGTVLAPFTTLAELASHWEAGKVVQFRGRVQVVQVQGGAPDVFVCEGDQENHTFIVGASCLNGIESGKWVTVQGKLWYDKRGNWTWAKDHPGCTLATVGEPEDGTYTPRTLTTEPTEADLFKYVKMQNVRKVDDVLVFGDGKKKIEKEQWWWGEYDNALYDEIYGVIVSNNATTHWKEIQICSGTKADQQTETINISEAAGFSTYAAPFNAAITRNDGAEVWYVSDWTSESLTFSKYEGETLQKGEGVLLKQGNTSVTFTPTNDECQALAGNKLKGNIVPTTFTAGEIFILSNGANGVGFYPNTAGTLKAGKAYLVKSEWEAVAGSAIGEFQMLFDDEETGIGNVNENVNENQSIYNLAGQRIAGLQKGINIVNGKKILK